MEFLLNKHLCGLRQSFSRYWLGNTSYFSCPFLYLLIVIVFVVVNVSSFWRCKSSAFFSGGYQKAPHFLFNCCDRHSYSRQNGRMPSKCVVKRGETMVFVRFPVRSQSNKSQNRPSFTYPAATFIQKIWRFQLLYVFLWTENINLLYYGFTNKSISGNLEQPENCIYGTGLTHDVGIWR